MQNPARVLEVADLRRLLQHVVPHQQAIRDRTIILLSFKAGLRACEIAGLEWSMALQPNGRLARQLFIASSVAKNGRSRWLPIHPELASAIGVLHVASGRPRDGPIIKSQRGGHMTARSIVNWFAALYDELGLVGCSSHSGRRTFITRAARQLARTGGSLKDVQELAGHRHLTTTEGYIQGDRDAQRKLVRLV